MSVMAEEARPPPSGSGGQRYAGWVFELFTDRARRVIGLAQEEARLLDHDYLGTEHLLLGLIREREGLAARILRLYGISLEAVRAEVVEIVGRGGGPRAENGSFTAHAKNSLASAREWASALDHHRIDTEHILMGLIHEENGVAARVLGNLTDELSNVTARIWKVWMGDRWLTTGPNPPRAGSAVRPRPGAVCSVCKIPSPDCGTLFKVDPVRPWETVWVLICEPCLRRVRERDAGELSA
jgi:Clp amino terminal domain, pathogenicity island component